MKIIHCLNHFIPEQIGGTEIYILSLAKSLLAHRAESVVLIPNYGFTTNEVYFVEGIKVVKYAEPSLVSRSLIMGKAKPLGVEAFTELLLEEAPAVVHFHTIGNSIGITLHHLVAARALGFKTVITFHLSGYSCKTGNLMYKDEVVCDGYIDIRRCTACVYAVKQMVPIKQRLLLSTAMLAYKLNYDTTNWASTLGTAIGFPFVIEHLKETLVAIVAHCDKAVVLTQWYKKVLLLNDIPEDKLVLISQGLPVQEYHPLQQVTDEWPAVIKLVFIGRIMEEKGLHLLIAAVQQSAPSAISLDIFAQPNDSAYAKALKNITAANLNISWKGLLAPGIVVATLAAYDVLCLPSIVCEMSPLVIQEAFAAGIPVIASNVYGNQEQVSDGINGWLFNFNDSNDLKIKLQMLIDNPMMIEEAKQMIPAIKTFDVVAQEYIGVYKNVLFN